MIELNFSEFRSLILNGLSWKAQVHKYALSHRKIVLHYNCTDNNSSCFVIACGAENLKGPLDWVPSEISLTKTEIFEDDFDSIFFDGQFSIKSHGAIKFFRDLDDGENILSSFDFGQYLVWVFIENNSKFPCAIFETRQSAEKWIFEENASGNLISYPVGGPTYEIDIDGFRLKNDPIGKAAIGSHISMRQENIQFQHGSKTSE